MDELELREKQKYDTLWRFHPEYREFSPAESLAPLFLDFFYERLRTADRVIDFGCGVGRSANFLLKAGLQPELVDFCDDCLDPEIFLLSLGPKPTVRFFQECLWNLSSNIKPAEWIICFDVLEHIPEEKIDRTLKNIFSRMNKGGLLGICLREDNHGAAIGEKLHMTVKPAQWWRERIAPYCSINELSTREDHVIWGVMPL